MAALTKKIDFIGFIMVERSNPNGDPLNGNQPRTDYSGYGEISDVCLKRKLRNRLQDAGEKILVQSNERADDGCDSIRARVEENPAMEKPLKMKDKEQGRTRLFAEEACRAWMDVRTFGQVFALKKDTGVDAVSVGVRGPVTIHTAVSLDPVTITGVQITKSVNNEPGDKKGSDTMGMKYRVDFGVYKFQGSINVQLAEKTGFNDEDAAKVKEALLTIFENDASSARPEGSMEMSRFYWIEHANKTGAASSAKVHRSVSAQKKDGVDAPSRIDDYVFDDAPLYEIGGVLIEKYVEGSLVD
ncbi:PF05107 family [Selenomonas sp. FOBRC6]|uniref:type I-C CRISPR-associated protein Cas7/Csd2 n=1 Tax=Selenomonas sp. FOBRC6 TaxID=936572 RepID=UPI0002781EC1|nr:type I-C CRISPR-associated protein Cas7/Csd2 [Selenomonas sp. FOBRC6]EJO19218.1 PF05107 family [Selenomonas sp. FOBRC6]